MVEIPGSTITFGVLSVALPLGLWGLSIALGGSPSSLVIGAVTLVLIGLTVLDYRFSRHRDEVEEALESQPLVRPISKDQFHERFEQAITRADRRAEICFFDNESPLASNREAKKSYYEGQRQLIEGNPNVRFRRIVRALPGTEDWIEGMINELQGIGTFSLACILDEHPERRSIPHISIQLVDEDQTFFVAVGQQTESRRPRDLYIRSEDVNSQWSRYYERLWENEAVAVMEEGQIRQDGLAKVREHIRDLE